MNRLLFGDNLKWLRDSKTLPNSCVDLVYLDPPLHSNANYNVLFKEASASALVFHHRDCRPKLLANLIIVSRDSSLESS